MSATVDLRIPHPRNAHPLDKLPLKYLKDSKKKRQNRRQQHEFIVKRRLQVAVRVSKKLEETRSRFSATTPPPELSVADRDQLDMLLAGQARASFGSPIVLNAS